MLGKSFTITRYWNRKADRRNPSLAPERVRELRQLFSKDAPISNRKSERRAAKQCLLRANEELRRAVHFINREGLHMKQNEDNSYEPISNGMFSRAATLLIMLYFTEALYTELAD